ncbi:domain of Kin17 curved DNA-binding protein-domain-containing protein [Pisolithus microcarpus]|nr:domain of Kin17 curved DNA-binding protein-domain-containing protein [Pisolithus microcarpus]
MPRAEVCQKQCRDENGFKCHAQSEAHLRQMLVVGEHAGRHIADFSSEFQHDFVQLLSRRFGTERVFANRVYQEIIQNKEHVHMNATRWWVAWIDNLPKALARQAATLQKERATMSDEQRERILITEQIERAKGQQEAQGLTSENEGAEKSQPTGGGGLRLSGVKSDINPLKTKPSKRPNALESVATSRPVEGATQSREKKRSASTLSAAERIILEEQERKRRRGESITA